ncbi:LytTR family DNA-binding domain-containing protein [Zhihengliuella alba]|uniref:LytTR family DNA-binding domain-containing protein n=1 Tax=Zhihengliuella alba TaxID=547018 RepID=A0ABP7D538_9MICC
MINVVVADDELPAVEELAYLLARDPRVGTVHRALSGAQALRALQEHDVDALFLDIHMPALSGLDIARAIAGQERPPAVVFVTADEAQALEAFELAAVDYVLKPIRPERLAESVRRVCDIVEGSAAESELVTVDQGGVTRMIRRADITHVQAHGDYARLHTAEGSYLIRIPLSDLEQQWAQSFVRIHRSYLVAMDHIERVRLQAGRATVATGGTELPVSRRALPYLRERLRSHRVRPS